MEMSLANKMQRPQLCGRLFLLSCRLLGAVAGRSVSASAARTTSHLLPRPHMTGPVIPSISWSQLYEKLNTGDIISFEGKSAMDYAIRLVEGEPYTHVGMVLKFDNELWFWDAPGEGNTYYDPISKNPNQKGARVADLKTIIEYYMNPTEGGEIAMWWRQLQPGVTPDQQAALMTFIGVADGTPFPGTDLKLPKPWNLGEGFAASWMFGVKANCTMAGSFFCAQLVAQSYMSMGMLPLSPPANAYDPAKFNSTDSTDLPLINASLTVPQKVSYPE
jgi:hypothetical protein